MRTKLNNFKELLNNCKSQKELTDAASVNWIHLRELIEAQEQS
jgi:hypothetical protein